MNELQKGVIFSVLRQLINPSLNKDRTVNSQLTCCFDVKNALNSETVKLVLSSENLKTKNNNHKYNWVCVIYKCWRGLNEFFFI